MRTSELESLTRAEREKVAKRANRKIGSEVSLILSAGFAFLVVVLFVFGDRTFLPIAEMLNLRPTFVLVALAALLSALWALLHYYRGAQRIAEARKLETEIRGAHQILRNAETEAKISNMKRKEKLRD